MNKRHFDVVVLGRSLGALATAALLARRDFSVLVLGQERRPASYRFERFQLKRRTFSLLFNRSPVWQRILQELAQSPSLKRRIKAVEPMFCFATEDRRLEIASDRKRFKAEIEREFPKVQQLVDDFYSRLASAVADIDDAFGRDAVWPPGTFMEKLEAGRTTSKLPFIGNRDPGDLLGKFPPEHPYRELATLPAVFATDLDYGLMGLPQVAFARLHGAWTRGLYQLEQGEEELEQFLVERVEANGGVCALNQSASMISTRGGVVSGVIESGDDEPIGTSAVVSDLSGEAIAALAQGEGLTKQAEQQWPSVSPTAGRFIVNVVVKTAALPDAVGQETFLLPREGELPNPREPVVHLQKYSPNQLGNDVAKDETLLVAESLLPADGALTLYEARAAVLNTLRFHLPFLDEHTVLIDSPHDGFPLELYGNGIKREVDRIHVKESSHKPEFMEHQWTVDPPGFLGLAGEPARGPIKGSFLVGKTTLPALGQEGELISAWSVARILTKLDSVRQRRRQQLWRKMETR